MKAQRRPLRVLGRCVKKPGALEGALPTGDPCPLQTPESSRSPCASVPLQDCDFPLDSSSFSFCPPGVHAGSRSYSSSWSWHQTPSIRPSSELVQSLIG